MGSLSGISLVLGIGVAIGMLTGSTGLHGSARGRMTLLAAAIGLVVGFLIAGPADVSSAAGAIFGLLGAVLACIVVSDVVHGATRREGGGSRRARLHGLPGRSLRRRPHGRLPLLRRCWSSPG